MNEFIYLNRLKFSKLAASILAILVLWINIRHFYGALNTVVWIGLILLVNRFIPDTDKSKIMYKTITFLGVGGHVLIIVFAILTNLLLPSKDGFHIIETLSGPYIWIIANLFAAIFSVLFFIIGFLDFRPLELSKCEAQQHCSDCLENNHDLWLSPGTEKSQRIGSTIIIHEGCAPPIEGDFTLAENSGKGSSFITIFPKR